MVGEETIVNGRSLENGKLILFVMLGIELQVCGFWKQPKVRTS